MDENTATEGRQAPGGQSNNQGEGDARYAHSHHEGSAHAGAGCGCHSQGTANRPCRGRADPNEVLLAATALAIALSKGKNRCEIETLVNLFSLTTSNLQSILVQMAINERAPNLDIVV